MSKLYTLTLTADELDWLRQCHERAIEAAVDLHLDPADEHPGATLELSDKLEQAEPCTTPKPPGKLSHCPHCGSELTSRSSPDHRRLFAIIGEAFKNWPENYEYFQPDTPEHLRAWMLCKLHHSRSTEIEIPDTVDARQLKAMMPIITQVAQTIMRDAKSYAFLREKNGRLVVYRPRSLSYGEVDQKYFNGIRDGIESIIQLVVGVTGDQLLEQAGGWKEVAMERTKV